MLNIEGALELVDEMRGLADRIERATLGDQTVAEKVLDFERGVCSLPELMSTSRELLESE